MQTPLIRTVCGQQLESEGLVLPVQAVLQSHLGRLAGKVKCGSLRSQLNLDDSLLSFLFQNIKVIKPTVNDGHAVAFCFSVISLLSV